METIVLLRIAAGITFYALFWLVPGWAAYKFHIHMMGKYPGWRFEFSHIKIRRHRTHRRAHLIKWGLAYWIYLLAWLPFQMEADRQVALAKERNAKMSVVVDDDRLPPPLSKGERWKY